MNTMDGLTWQGALIVLAWAVCCYVIIKVAKPRRR